MSQWYTAAGVGLAGMLAAAALGAFWVEGLKRSLLKPLIRRKARDPDPYDRALFWAWLSGAVLGSASGFGVGWAVGGRLAIVVLGIGGTIGGLGSKVFFDRILEPVIRALGMKASKRIAGRTVAPKPETQIGMPAATDEDAP